MKKITAILTVAVLLLTLFITGCDKKEKTKDESSKVSSVTSEEEVLPVGTYKDNTYINDFFGFKLSLDSNWTYKNAEELKEINKLTADVITDENIKEILENQGAFIDMYATNSDGLNKLNVTIEESITQGGFGTPKDYADYAVGNLKAPLENNGITVDDIYGETVTFAGSEHPAIRIKGSMNSMPLEELIVVLKAEDYFCCVTFVTNNSSDLNALAGSVEKI